MPRRVQHGYTRHHIISVLASLTGQSREVVEKYLPKSKVYTERHVEIALESYYSERYPERQFAS